MPPFSPLPSPRFPKPIIIGIYGVPGCGKSTLMDKVKHKQSIVSYEGADVIRNLTEGGMDAFRKLGDAEKYYRREDAIKHVRDQCSQTGEVGVVAGHLSLWDGVTAQPKDIYTQADLNTYSHIIYLQVEGKHVAQQVANDTTRPDRPRLHPDQVDAWQEQEMSKLALLCREHKIQFTILPSNLNSAEKFQTIIEEASNTMMAREVLDTALTTRAEKLDCMLVIDGDKTLATEDTGDIFWKLHGDLHALKRIFSSNLQYSFAAFQQATRMYEEVPQFDLRCSQVASQVQIHPEFLKLIQSSQESGAVGALVVTCGLGVVWEKVLELHGLSEFVKVIGSRHSKDGLVVTAQVKADLVRHLRGVYKLYVCAFGDSQLDIPMLQAANEAVVVVGDERTRSKSMETLLEKAIDEKGLQARQVALPKGVSARLQATPYKLPSITLKQITIAQSLRNNVRVISATHRPSAKLLMTPMRDAIVSGPALREAHRQVGQYLAIEFLAEEFGLQFHPIKHVQGGVTDGYRLFCEDKTLIVALMRGGEPMASGVSEVLPKAMFLHAKEPEQILFKHVRDQSSVVLVDSVVNRGDTIVEFVKHLRKLRPAIRIFVVTGVAQKGAVLEEGLIAGKLKGLGGITLIALRISNNQYKGQGKTDTGARLFNTTELE